MMHAHRHGLILALVLAVGAFAFYGCRGHGFGHPSPEKMYKMLGWHLNDVLDDLDVDQPQRDQINAIKDRLWGEWRAMHDKSKAHKQELLAMWRSDNPDKAAVRAHADEHHAQMRAFGDKVADAVLEIHGILTPAQRAKAADMLEKHLTDL